MTVCARGSVCVTLEWDPVVPEAGLPEIAGYRIYCGPASRTYTNLVSVASTNGTVCGLNGNVRSFFAVTAYDVFGVESDYSVEVDYLPRPSLQLVRSGQTSAVSWSTNYAGWTAEASVDLVTWMNLGAGVIEGNRFVVRDAAAGARRFYRLRKAG